jgi:hypothetical protein
VAASSLQIRLGWYPSSEPSVLSDSRQCPNLFSVCFQTDSRGTLRYILTITDSDA